MNKRLTLASSAIAASLVMSVAALGPSSPASAAGTVYGCTAKPGNPYITYYSGVKYAEANIYVTCSTGRTGIAVGQIKEDDGLNDDEVTPEKSFSFTIGAGQTQKVGTIRGRCSNFDLTGAEELFTRGKVNVGGINSDWQSTQVFSATC